MMTLQELRNMVEELSEQYPEDTEVFILQQPSWPFLYSVRNVVGSDDLYDPELEDEETEDEVREEGAKRYILITEGNQIGYASKNDTSAFEM